ncbi:mitochondrial poly(A) polymerase [Carabus blaptoides fortunei]
MSRSLLCGHILQIKNCGFGNIKQKSLSLRQWKTRSRTLCRQLSQKTVPQPNKNVPFSELIRFRKEQAQRSIIVQVQSAQSYRELHAYCNQIGNVKYMFHYTSGVEPLHFILIEFASECDVHNVLTASCHSNDNQAVPVKSPFLWFRVAPTGQRKTTLKLAKAVKLDVENGHRVPVNETVMELLKSADTISDQMRVLHETTKLNDLGVRLRFLTARQVELAVSGMFPDAVAYPFGSSINGYGKMGCDLDLILRLHGSNEVQVPTDTSRLVYQCKAGLGNERSQSQRHMEAIGDLLHLFLPGCSQVRRILQARVPILKYNQQFTDIECDLSMTNMTALHMSELLYLYGTLDDRVRPLVFTVRKWAYELGLTNSSPGRWITNFSLTLLVLAFLQQRTHAATPAVLPTVNTVLQPADNNDTTITFLSDVSQLHSYNTDSLASLLLQFFDYYSAFDFNSRAISLNEAVAITKPEHSALYIVNPLERTLNVSKNVSIEELERLRIELRNAAWTMELQQQQEDRKQNGKWGVLTLFANSYKTNRGFYATTQTSRPNTGGRMMEVSKLFDMAECKTSSDSRPPQVDEIKKETQDRKRRPGNVRRSNR